MNLRKEGDRWVLDDCPNKAEHTGRIYGFTVDVCDDHVKALAPQGQRGWS